MVFSSFLFLLRFLPIFLIAYFVAKPQYRNLVLLIGSLVFYAFGEPIYILLMCGSIYVNHLLTRKISLYRRKEQRTGKNFRRECNKYLIWALLFNLGILFIFKYLGFALSVLNGIIGADIFPVVELALPLGISFYTFQILSYVIDVYRGDYPASNGILDFATYVAMFPQLIAGPIVNFREVREQMRHREVDFKKIEWGVILFIMGLTYKVLLANKIGSLWNDVQTVGVLGINTATAWLGSWGYSMQLFFDFFGYSLMAIGLGKILGFDFPINFDNPYCSLSATEFWRRWHITLGRWFRNYVYIPLGGNRVGVPRWIFNMFVVWALTGFWHGANWNFVIWGLFFFVILILEKKIYLKYLEKNKLAGHIYMLILIPVSWTIFNITELPSLVLYLKRMFFIPIEGTVITHGVQQFFQLFGTYWWLLAICAFCCTPIPMWLVKNYRKSWILKVIMLVLFWLCLYSIAQGGNNPFLYFRF